jgi:hypothetical protein
MKYVILVEETFQYLDLGPDSDEPIFGRKEYIFEMEFSLEDLPNVDKIIKRRLGRKYSIKKYQEVHNPATERQIQTLMRFGSSEFYARTRTKRQASELISNEIESRYDDRDRDWPDPMEDWLQERYNGGGE